MNNFESFLKNLSDVELATFIAYRKGEYKGKLKELIEQEVELRGISEYQLRKLYDIGMQRGDANYCPRCYSNKVSIEKQQETVYGNSGLEKQELGYLSCHICGFTSMKKPFSSFVS